MNQFDFGKFSQFVRELYPDGYGSYSLEDVLGVFKCYFQDYREYTGHDHPILSRKSVTNIVEKMPFINQEYRGGLTDVEPFEYPALIEDYFSQPFPRSDRNINHFFSGRIRELSYYRCL